MYSARTDIALPDETVIIGELSLAGEIRPVPRLRQRVKTAKELGFNNVLAPENESGAKKISSVKNLLREVAGK